MAEKAIQNFEKKCQTCKSHIKNNNSNNNNDDDNNNSNNIFEETWSRLNLKEISPDRTGWKTSDTQNDSLTIDLSKDKPDDR